MSLVLGGCREVSVGPTVGLQGDVGGGGGGAAAEMTCSGSGTTGQEKQRVVSCLLEVVQKEKTGLLMKLGSAASKSSSAINRFASESLSFDDDDDDDDVDEEEEEDDDDDDDEMKIKFKGPLASMDSLEESLPIKRGLSNFFSGKSKSFANLSEVTSVTDLAKPENPFNKRRRTLIARSWRARRPFHSSLSLASVPALASSEEDEDDAEV